MTELRTMRERLFFMKRLHERLAAVERALGHQWFGFHDYLLDLLKDLQQAATEEEAADLTGLIVEAGLDSPAASIFCSMLQEARWRAGEERLGPTSKGFPTGPFTGPVGLPKGGLESAPVVRMGATVRHLLEDLGPALSRPAMVGEPETRYFNVLFTDVEGEEPLSAAEPLVYDRAYLLYVDVSPERKGLVEENVPFPDAALEEVWEDEASLSITVWVASRDFDVQPKLSTLSLPRSGPSSGLRFSVRPLLREGRARLQVELFYRGHLLQSQRVEVEVVAAAGMEPLPAPRPVQTARMTFTTTARLEPEALRELPARVLTIDIARDPRDGSLDLRFLDRTGGEEQQVAFFDTHLQAGSLGQAVTDLRTQLLAAVTGEGERRGYQWIVEGDDELLDVWLPKWALVGHRLYRVLTGRGGEDGEREALEAHLRPGDVIQVNPVVGIATLPWALLYERPIKYVPGRTRVCRDSAGCAGDHADCAAAGRSDLVCPYAFWGYRHTIEQLPCWITGELPALPTVIRRVRNSAPLPINVNVWRDFSLWREHLAHLEGVGDIELLVAEELSEMEAIWEARGAELGLVYFYSHGGENALLGPYLKLSDAALNSDFIEASNLQWNAAPLVFLNGCATGDYGPESYVSLITDFREAGASGVVGTECPVPELFAETYARLLLPRIFQGEALGPAMLAVRRELLRRQKNPLGLIYTLYAANEVSLEQPVGG